MLSERAIQAYFGTRVKIGQLVESAQRYAEMDERRTRLENSAALAARVAAPDGGLVVDELAKFMNNWTEFKRDFPMQAQVLEPLHEKWIALHPGRGPNKKDGENKGSKPGKYRSGSGGSPQP